METHLICVTLSSLIFRRRQQNINCAFKKPLFLLCSLGQNDQAQIDELARRDVARGPRRRFTTLAFYWMSFPLLNTFLLSVFPLLITDPPPPSSSPAASQQNNSLWSGCCGTNLDDCINFILQGNNMLTPQTDTESDTSILSRSVQAHVCVCPQTVCPGL